MLRPRPTLFIGSSTEGLPVAKALQLLLDRTLEVTVWSQGVFGLSQGTLESLVAAVNEYDFALLALTPDDLVTSRDTSAPAPRDNVLFELGLFMGAIGRQRTYLLYDRTAQLRLPSDLAGVFAATYEPHVTGNLPAALGAAATQIEEHVLKLGRRSEPVGVPTESKYAQLVRDLAAWLLSAEVGDPLVRGVALREVGQLNRAIEILEAAARREPRYPRYHSNAAHAYARKGKLDSAISHLLTALKIRREDDGIEWPGHHFHTARYLLARSAPGDEASAIQHLTNAIAAGPRWEQKALGESTLFGNVVDNALVAARELRNVAAQQRAQTILRVKEAIATRPEVLHCAIYGSYQLNGATWFRDVDVVAVTLPPHLEPELIALPSLGDAAPPIHLYLIPEATLLDDLKYGTYGQYFSYKYILGAESVANELAVDACTLAVIKQAIRNAAAWQYRAAGESLLAFKYKTEWFLGVVLKQEISRNRTFVRCLRKLLVHYTDDGLTRLLSLYRRALHDLRQNGELDDGPGRQDAWTFSGQALANWSANDTSSDEQIADRFWRTYEHFKQPAGKAAVQAKKAMVERLPPRSVQDIANRIEDLIGNGRLASDA